MNAVKEIWDTVKYIIDGIAVVAEEDDPELWDEPRKRERIRRRTRRERSGFRGKKADV